MRVVIPTKTVTTSYKKIILRAIARGIKNQGDTAILTPTYDVDLQNYDTAVIWGSYKSTSTHPRYTLKKKIIEHFEKRLVVETPLVGRNMQSAHIMPMIRLGVNGHLRTIAVFPDKIDNQKVQSFKKIYDPKSLTQGKEILVIMRTENDSSLQGADIFAWTLDTVQTLRQHTERKICVRSHPLMKDMQRLEELMEDLQNIKDVSFQSPDASMAKDIGSQLNNTFATIIYSSGSGVDSILQGVPVFAHSELSICYPVAMRDLSQIENARIPNIEEWLSHIAMIHYTLDELEEGSWWQLYKELL